MQKIGDYQITDNKVYAVVDVDWERRFERCNAGTSIASTVSYRVETPIIKEVDKEFVERLLKENQEWLTKLIEKRKDCNCNIEYGANDIGYLKASYAVEKFTELLGLLNETTN
jgi:hypothetical protein